MSTVTVYGTAWSVATWDVRRLLEEIAVPHIFVDLEQDEEARLWVMSLGPARGRPVTLPVVACDDGTLLQGASRRDVANYFGVRLDTGTLKQISANGFS